MDRYLTDREKTTGVLAFDAVNPPIAAMGALPGPLGSDPNAALPWMLTSAIDPEIIRFLFSPLDFPEILGERKAGDWTEQTRFFPSVEATGEVSSYDDFVNNGRAGANFNYPQLQSYLFRRCRTGELQIARAGLAKINWVSSTGMAAADLLNRFQNLSYAFGVAELQNYGIINSPFISAPWRRRRAWGGTSWFNNRRAGDRRRGLQRHRRDGHPARRADQWRGRHQDADDARDVPELRDRADVRQLLRRVRRGPAQERHPNLKGENEAPDTANQSTTNPQGYSAATGHQGQRPRILTRRTRAMRSDCWPRSFALLREMRRPCSQRWLPRPGNLFSQRSRPPRQRRPLSLNRQRRPNLRLRPAAPTSTVEPVTGGAPAAATTSAEVALAAVHAALP